MNFKITKTPFRVIIIIVALAGFAFASATAGYWLYQKVSADKTSAAEKEPVKIGGDDVAGAPHVEETKDREVKPPSEEVPAFSPIDSEEGAIVWQEPKEIEDLHIFDEPSYTYAGKDRLARYYAVGSIARGKYSGGTVVLMTLFPKEIVSLDQSSVLYRFVQYADKLYLLSRYSFAVDAYTAIDASKFTVDPIYGIADLDTPSEIVGLNERQKLVAREVNAFFNPTGLRTVFEHPQWGTVYTHSDTNKKASAFDDTDPYGGNAFYLRAADGTLLRYVFDVDFMVEGKYNVPDITWNNGEKNTDSYTSTDVGGCGSVNFASVMDPNQVNIKNDLVIVGTNGKGDFIYEFKDKNSRFLKEFYEKSYVPIVETPISYEDFVLRHPLFFWVDPFDRLIKFQSNGFIPQAECGKPVIYLYPEKTTRVSVHISPQGGLRYSKPAYNGGWEVIAHPDGRLIETKTGVEYPYLFWEGRGGIYETPKKGFVVQKENVHTFLTEKLALFGLNNQEIKDFTEYWEPYMSEAPYYFVTFLTGRLVDELAPLKISPKPDTIIRVLMDFEPLKTPRAVEGYEIYTPERRGFSVVEWGGVKKNWEYQK